MRANVIRIGNSRGLRIPKAVLEQLGIEDVVDLAVEEDRLVVRPVRTARAGWAQAARVMAECSDDAEIDAPTPTAFDRDEWEW